MNSKTILFSFVTVTLLKVLSVAEATGSSQYALKTDPDNEDFKKYMQAMGYSEDVQRAIVSAKNVLISFKQLNDTHLYIESSTGLKSSELIFEPGKEFEVELPNGREVKNTLTVNAKKNTLHRVIKMDGFEANQDAVFDDNGFNLNMKAKGAAATFRFELAKNLVGRENWMDTLGKLE